MPGEPRTVRRKLLKRRAARAKPETPAAPRIPRIARLMACAIVFDEMLARGEVRSYRELAAIGQVSPARISQVMGLLELAPGVQEELLDGITIGRGEPVLDRQLRNVSGATLWAEQWILWPLNPKGRTPRRWLAQIRRTP